MLRIQNISLKLIPVAMVALFCFSASPALAAWDGNYYSPGATLNPECSPGQANCDVAASASNFQQVTDAGKSTNHPIQFAGATSTANFVPGSTGSYNLGSSSLRWDHLFTTNGIYASGTVIGSNLLTYGNATLGGDLLSDTTARNIGSTLSRWSSLFLNNGVYASGTIMGTGLLSYGSALPGTDDTYDLGSSLFRWRNLKATSASFTTLYVNGTQITGNGGSQNLQQVLAQGYVSNYPLRVNGVSSTAAILPSSNNLFDLGSISNTWRNIYASSTIFANASRIGPQVIQNTETTPVNVAANFRITPPAYNTATENAALYIRTEHRPGQTDFVYGIYGEVDDDQSMVGGSFSKVIHRGRGDGHYVALFNPTGGFGYEAAMFKDQEEGFIATWQGNAGFPESVSNQANSIGFQALLADDGVNPGFVSNYGMFFANNSMGNAITVRNSPFASSGQQQFRVVDTNYRSNFAVHTNGETHLYGQAATSGAPQQSSPQLVFRGYYWDGAASQPKQSILRTVIDGSNNPNLYFYVGAPSAETLSAILSETSLSLQNHNLLDTNGITMYSGGVGIDMSNTNITQIKKLSIYATTTTGIDLQGSSIIQGNDLSLYTISARGGNDVKLTGHWFPITTDSYDLGSSAYRWKNLWAKNATFTTLYVNGVQITNGGTQNLQDVTNQGYVTTNPIRVAGVSSTASIVPTAAGAYDLGSASTHWSNLFVNFVTSSRLQATDYVSTTSLYVSGEGRFFGAQATVGTPQQTSAQLVLRGHYWDGAASQPKNSLLKTVIDGANNPYLYFYVGAPSAETLTMLMSASALSLQNHNLVDTGGITMYAAGTGIDSQNTNISNLKQLVFYTTGTLMATPTDQAWNSAFVFNTNGTISNSKLLSVQNNRVEKFSISADGTLMAAATLPSANNTYDLGSQSLAWKDVYASGTMRVASSTLFVNGTSGNVGVGTDSPDQGKVEVRNGTVCVDTNNDGNASSCIASESDERLKENIATVENALEKIKMLRGVTFDWKTDDLEVIKHYPLITRFADKKHSMGLIAQEVQGVLPEAIQQETLGDEQVQYMQVDYTKVVPLLIEAVKEQQVQIDSLKQAESFSVESLNDQVISGALEIEGQTNLGSDSAGLGKILSGKILVSIVFDKNYTYQPVVTISPMGRIAGSYWVSNITTAGFDIELEQAQDHDLVFGWHAFGVKNGKLFSSDGSIEAMDSSEPPAQIPSPVEASPEPPIPDEPPIEQPVSEEPAIVSTSTEVANP